MLGRRIDDGSVLSGMADFVNGTPMLKAEAGIPADRVLSADEVGRLVAMGTAGRCAERLRAYLDAGVTELAVVTRSTLDELDAVLDRL
jgi:alkanesulfonate monooxygenase SsuD/methylene tetrahydromethanopterin reductase-like flavin-dependent oxidoreductase (luciferase family)